MNLEIKQVKIKGYEEMFKLEAYRYRMSELEREAKLTEVERKERAQFWKLAHKYGYSVLPSDLELPFWQENVRAVVRTLDFQPPIYIKLRADKKKNKKKRTMTQKIYFIILS